MSDCNVFMHQLTDKIMPQFQLPFYIISVSNHMRLLMKSLLFFASN